MATIHSLGQDDLNEVKHDYFGNLTPLVPALALHDASGVINGTIAFLVA